MISFDHNYTNLNIFKIFLLLISIKFVFSIIPPQPEYDCISNIKIKYGTTIDLNELCDTAVQCDPTTGSILKMVIFPYNTDDAPLLLINDILCLPFLQYLTIQYIPFENGFIYYNFPAMKSMTIKDSMNSLSSGITQQLPNYDYFEISTGEIDQTILNLLYISNVKSFKSSIGYVWLVCDPITLGTNFITNTLEISALNYPDFTSYPQFEKVLMNFNDNFDKLTIPNFQTISSNLMRIKHNIASPSLTTSTEFYAHLNYKVNKLYIDSRLSTPAKFFDFSKNKNYGYLQLTNIQDFHINGNFPVLNIQKNTTILLFNGSSLIVFPPINQWGDVNNFVRLDYITLNLPLPNFTGSGEYYILIGNSITGTIDKSWCNTEISVQSNLLTGTIPSCFTCYFKNPKVDGIDVSPTSLLFDRFQGNSFTNHNISIPCTTFLPRITVLQRNPLQIKVFGQDIGYDPRNWLLNGTIGTLDVKKVLIGREYHLTFNNTNFNDVDYFPFLFKLPNYTIYTFPVVEKHPIITKVTIISPYMATIEGSYFSSCYGYNETIIMVGLIHCSVTTTSFFNIICETVVSNPFEVLTQQVFIINIGGNKMNIVYINSNQNTINDQQCPNGCTDLDHGICDMSTGKCQCNSNYQDSDCSIAILNCPSNSASTLCSGNGECNTVTGECICNSDFQSDDCSMPFIGCPFDGKGRICYGHGTCNNITGICTCDDNYQSTDCSIPFAKCPSINSIFECSGFGQCENTTGVCTCDEFSFSDDCSLHNCLEPSCNSNGKCDLLIGQCKCNSLYTGDDCLIPLHFVSSIIPSLETGGPAIFYGYFGDLRSNLKLSIGGLPCQITFNSSNLINCTAPPGTGIKSITVTQNDIVWLGKDIYKYISNFLKCPNDCSNNGKCNQTTLECDCFPNFGSFDCSGSIDNTPKSNVTIDTNSSTTVIKNQEINFQIYYKQLLEVDYNGKIIKQYNLNNNWNSNKSSLSPSSLDQIEHIFTQSINDGNNQCKIISNIKEILKKQEITFGETIFKLEPNSIKLTISIQNYTYQNNLNTLKLEMVASVNQDDNDNDNDCNNNESNIDTSNSNDLSLFNYIKISKNNKLFSGRFINRVLSDGVSTFLSSTTTTSSSTSDFITVTLNLPHCKKECVIDPDFSVLVTSKFQQNCENDDNNKKYVIPVAVVVSVVGATAIAGAAYLLYRKKYVENQLKIKLKIFK
ncbi:hypothetical protein DDB_G0268314 [Dictyostelium discoideum AX4]|uniref:EGF-like domain-containing protein n=1 Tax=Dictyostelium discoideum TaxID=44689 RepID=Q55GF5_DICDI|nr:hypothetical protein DDB_G0268314 [Dictyostelium discoideum AX4]EAL73610.1 hypothetical protein DDB_G0268314 [Dictyostelium discoideum AX4]|eukprot:XP_647229.1 hypothetical protein DDB_G0268314 [Dictyostelium discoideum AX4]